jgi:hypothetical protein
MFVMAENLQNNAHNGLESIRVSLSPLIVDYCAEDFERSSDFTGNKV